MEVWEQSLG